jgi:hypothetical protein
MGDYIYNRMHGQSRLLPNVSEATNVAQELLHSQPFFLVLHSSESIMGVVLIFDVIIYQLSFKKTVGS